MTKTKITLVLALLGILGYGAFHFGFKKKPDIAWRTAAVTLGSVEKSVTATGKLEALTTVLVGTQVSGTIAALYADFNSEVKKGQVIARLDSTLLSAALQDALSNMARAEAQAFQADEELKRTKALFDKDLMSQAELDRAKAQARVAEANSNSARAQVDRSRINLRYATITSPIDGIVLSRAVDVGQTVAASFSAPTLFILAGDLREMQVKAAVDEADIGKIQKDQSATFSVDAYPEETFTGVVEQVRLQPLVEQNVVTYDVVIRVPNPERRLMPGMTANLAIIVDRRENVLVVPAAALSFRPPVTEKSNNGGERRPSTPAGERRDGGGRAGGGRDGRTSDGEAGAREASGRVFLLKDGNPVAVRVRVGLSDGIRNEVRGELQAGDLAVTGMEAEGTRPGGQPSSPFGMQPRRRR